MDDMDMAQQREHEDRERALAADAERRKRARPVITGAIALCVDKCGRMVEEKRIAHGYNTCADCAHIAELDRNAAARRGPGRRRYA